jgi:hypothetical protein
VKKRTAAAYKFLRSLKGPKADKIKIPRLTKKFLDPEMIGLFRDFASSHLKKTPQSKLTKAEEKVANMLTYFTTLGYILSQLEEESKTAAISMKKVARRRPPIA